MRKQSYWIRGLLERHLIKIAPVVFPRLRKGVGLAEIAIGLVIIAIVVALAAAGFTMANTNRKTAKLIGEVNTLIGAVQTITSAKPDYEGLTTASLEPVTPQNMWNGTSMMHAFNGIFTVSASNGAGTTTAPAVSHFMITMTDVPMEPCIALMNLETGRNSAKFHGTGPTPLTQALCGSTNTLRLVIR